MYAALPAGFSADSLAGRILDSKPRAVLTAGFTRRANKAIGLKAIVDEALAKCEAQGHLVRHVLVAGSRDVPEDVPAVSMRVGLPLCS